MPVLVLRAIAAALLLAGACVAEEFYCDGTQNLALTAAQKHVIVTRRAGEKFYSPRLHCSWHLYSNLSARLLLSFPVSELEWTPDNALCESHDRVQITNRSSLLYEWCKNAEAPEHMVVNLWTPGDQLSVQFTSNALMVRGNRGVRAVAQLLPGGTCPSDWHLHAGACYFLLKRELAFVNAQRMCNLAKANLATFVSLSDFVSVITKFGTRTAGGVWMGLTDSRSSGDLLWLQGSRFKLRLSSSLAVNGSAVAASRSALYSSSECRCGQASSRSSGVSVLLTSCRSLARGLCAMPLAPSAAADAFAQFNLPQLHDSDASSGGLSSEAALAILLAAVAAAAVLCCSVAAVMRYRRSARESRAYMPPLMLLPTAPRRQSEELMPTSSQSNELRPTPAGQAEREPPPPYELAVKG